MFKNTNRQPVKYKYNQKSLETSLGFLNWPWVINMVWFLKNALEIPLKALTLVLRVTIYIKLREICKLCITA